METQWKQEDRQLCSDEQLITRYYSANDKDAVALLFNRYLKSLCGYCRYYLRIEADCEDAAMSTFEKVLRSIPEYTPDNFLAWLLSVARNECLMILRNGETLSRKKDAWEKIHNLYFDPSEVGQMGAKNAIDSLQLYKALKKLGKPQRKCIELFFFKGKSYREIAHQLGCSQKEVKSNLQNGKRNLRKLLLAGK
jgi:RNA polymerase sigma factor (sigma-70 family)